MSTSTSVAETLQNISAGVTDLRTRHDQQYEELKDRLEGIEAGRDRPSANVAPQRESAIARQHKGAFFEWIRRPLDDSYKHRLSDAQHELAKERKDVLIGTNASGGFALPEQIEREIENRVRQLNPFRRLVSVRQCGTNDYKQLVSLADGTSGWVGETTTRSATLSPSLRERAPTMGELYAYPQASNWSLEDLFFDVQRWLVDDISADWSAAEATAIISGNGTNRPTGILNTTPVITADTASPMRAAAAIEYVKLISASSPVSLNMDSLIALVYQVAERYLQESAVGSVAFVMHRLTASLLRRLKASTAGSYLWQESSILGQPATLLGYPVYTCDAMPTVANDNFAVLFGNFARGYLLADRSGMTITVDPYTTPGYTKFYVRRRVGGCVLNNDALKALRIAD